MKGSFFPSFLAAVLLTTFTASPVQARWDWTVGLASINIGSDLGKVIDNDFGLSAGFTNHFSENFAFDFSLDRSLHDTAVAGATDLTYQRWNFGLRYFFLSRHSFDLYGAAGMTIHDLWFNDDYGDDISGISPYYGAGLEVPLNQDRTSSFNFTLRKSDWEGEWDPGSVNIDASTIVIEAALRVYFSFGELAQ